MYPFNYCKLVDNFTKAAEASYDHLQFLFPLLLFSLMFILHIHHPLWCFPTLNFIVFKKTFSALACLLWPFLFIV